MHELWTVRSDSYGIDRSVSPRLGGVRRPRQAASANASSIMRAAMEREQTRHGAGALPEAGPQAGVAEHAAGSPVEDAGNSDSSPLPSRTARAHTLALRMAGFKWTRHTFLAHDSVFR